MIFSAVAFFSLLVFLLPQAEARFFDFFEKFLGRGYETSRGSLNSQVLPILSAPLNINPLAGQGGGDITIVQNSALLAITGPLGSIADVVEQKPDSISLYVVRGGDTLSDVANIFDVSVNTIRWANNLNRSTIIRPGQVLVILPVSGVNYTIKESDTIQSIAKKFKGDVDEILNFNGMAFGDVLVIGSTVIIPDGEGETLSNISSGKVVRGSGGPYYRGFYARPIFGGRRSQGLHGYNGVDLATYCGAPVLASASGDIIIARSYGWNGGYGDYTAVSHSNGTQTLYAHLSSVIVSPGWHVVQGQILGYVGSTGRSTGCHVHFEVRGAANPF